MISFLVSSLLSVCLLSPVQSPDCAGGIGVSIPAIPAPISTAPPVTIQLPVPLPLPPVPGSPIQITTPPLPAPVPAPQPLPVPVPVQPLPAPVPPPIAVNPEPAPETPQPPVQPQPVTPEPVPTPTPSPTYDGLSVIESAGAEVEAAPVPAPEKTPDTQRPGWLDGPFNDGSVGAAIGNTILHFPDYGLLLLIIFGVGIALLTEGLDKTPKVEDKSDLFD